MVAVGPAEPRGRKRGSAFHVKEEGGTSMDAAPLSRLSLPGAHAAPPGACMMPQPFLLDVKRRALVRVACGD
jgi:hypothetical protein